MNTSNNHVVTEKIIRRTYIFYCDGPHAFLPITRPHGSTYSYSAHTPAQCMLALLGRVHVVPVAGARPCPPARQGCSWARVGGARPA